MQHRLASHPSLHRLADRPTTGPLLEQVVLPLAAELAQQQQRAQWPIVLGILGGQGTGKTTLAALLGLALAELGVRSLSLSLDDLYKTYADRLALRRADPRLVWRGPPGTHDVDLGLATLDRLRAGQGTEIPRFDKSLQGGAGDRLASQPSGPVEVVLFEGWFVGARPVEPQVFSPAGPASHLLELAEPAALAFAADCNQRLGAYVPLWERCDRLLLLRPIDYRLSLGWRQQAERERVAAGGEGMGEAEIAEFVRYFWQSLHPQLFIDPLVEAGHPHRADWVVEFDGDRRLLAPLRL